MLALFTNCNGDINRGVVLDIHESGLFEIKWEPFDILIDKIVRRNPAHAEIAHKSLGARVGWSRLRKNSRTGVSLTVMPETGDSAELTEKYRKFGGNTYLV